MRFWLAAAALAAFPAMAAAEEREEAIQPSPRDFEQCDGYEAPNRRGDGMTEIAGGFLGIFNSAVSDREREDVRFNRNGMAACDRALLQADRLLPAYHLRRANLLRARGLHRMRMAQFDDALLDLDAADAEGATQAGPLYDRSMAVGNDLLRAYALTRRARREKAMPLLEQIHVRRPYSAKLRMAALNIGMLGRADWQQYQAQLSEMATFHPEARTMLFAAAFYNTDWETMLATRPQIDFSPPRESVGGYEVTNYAQEVAELANREALFDIMTAYALAAAGREEEQIVALEALRQTVNRQNAAAIVAKPGEVADLQANLTDLEANIELLGIARTGDPEAFLNRLTAGPIGPSPMVLYAFRILRANMPDMPVAGEVDQVIAQLTDRLDRERAIPPIGLAELYEAMPGAETEDNLPRYKGARNIIGENTGNGYITIAEGPVTLINFGGNTATSSMVEEMALLRAAELAQQAGHTHFAILSKHMSQRTLRVSGYYGYGSTSPMGWSGNLRVITFGAEGQAAPFEALADRSIDAARIMAELGPIYLDDD
jgi:hypothetical protein